MDFVAEHVAPYKKVRQVAFIDAIPKSASGKILRKDLRRDRSSRGSELAQPTWRRAPAGSPATPLRSAGSGSNRRRRPADRVTVTVVPVPNSRTTRLGRVSIRSTGGSGGGTGDRLISSRRHAGTAGSRSGRTERVMHEHRVWRLGRLCDVRARCAAVAEGHAWARETPRRADPRQPDPPPGAAAADTMCRRPARRLIAADRIAVGPSGRQRSPPRKAAGYRCRAVPRSIFGGSRFGFELLSTPREAADAV